MQTLGDLLSFFTLKRSDAKATLRNPVAADYPPGGKFANFGNWSDERQARLAMQAPWSYSGIHRIAMASLAAELSVKRRAGEDTEDIPNHPIEILVQSPNPDMSREYLWIHTIYSLYLKAAYWFIYPDSRGNIAELWPMPFSRVTPIPNESPNPESLFAGFLYKFKNGQQELMIPRDNVVYLRFPDPFDPYGAMSPLKALLNAVMLDVAQTSWNTNLFDANKGLPASIISVPETLDNNQLEQVRRDLRDNVGQRMVTRAGLVTVQFMQETHQEIQFLEGLKFNQETIYKVLGVPISEETQDGQRWFINNTVWPVLQMIAGQITTQLTKPYFGPDIFAEFDDIRVQDRSIAVQESVQYSPWRSFNEERATRGEPALPKVTIPEYCEGFSGQSLYDDIPARLVDQIMPLILKGEPEPVPPQLAGFAGPPSMPGSAGATHDQVTEAEAEQPDAIEIEDEMPMQPEAMAKWEKIAVKKLKGGSAAHVYLDPALDPVLSFDIATLLGQCRTESEVKAVFAHGAEYKAEIGGGPDIPQSQLDQEQEFTDPLQAWLNDQVSRITQNTINGEPPPQPFWDNEKKLLSAFLVLYLARWTEAGIAETVTSASALGLGITADVNARAAQWAGQYAAEMARGITATTMELVRAKIKQNIVAGGSIADLSAALGEVVAPKWRASMIAQTEITRAYAMANQEIAKELGIEKGLHWITRRDERVCPFCSPNDGKPISRVGSPPAHPRCRCGTYMQL